MNEPLLRIPACFRPSAHPPIHSRTHTRSRASEAAEIPPPPPFPPPTHPHVFLPQKQRLTVFAARFHSYGCKVPHPPPPSPHARAQLLRRIPWLRACVRAGVRAREGLCGDVRAALCDGDAPSTGQLYVVVS